MQAKNRSGGIGSLDNITLFEHRNDVNIKYRESQNKQIEKHWHRFIEIEILTSGSGTHRINENSYPIRRGEMHLLKLTDIHELFFDENCGLYLIQIPTTYLLPEMNLLILNYPKDMIVYLDEAELCQVENLCKILIGQSQNAAPYSPDIIKSTIVTICLLLFQKLNINKQDAHKNGKSWINDIIIFIQNNFQKSLNVSKIAERFYMNNEYFSRYFKKHMGVGPREYLVALRMEHAKKLVRQSPLKILDISEACGYSSVTAFLRNFRQKYNCTPTQMREKQSNS